MSKDSLVPKNTSYKARQNHDPEAWLRFSRKCQKNPHMRKTVRERDGNRCQWCSGLIKDHQEPVLHHIDYDHVCTFAVDVSTYSPTAKRPQRMFNGPDCRKCEVENVAGFQACVSRLALVHSYCNFQISKRK